MKAYVGDELRDLTAEEVAEVEAGRAADLAAYVNQRRWELETGGIEVAGAPIRTDEKSQAKIQGAFQLAQQDSSVEIDWEAQPGQWVTLDAPTMIGIGLAAARHVQRCFSAARQVGEMVTAGELRTREQVDAAFAAALEE